MSKILLINPKIPSLSSRGFLLPTGLLWLGSYLNQNGHEVKIINAHGNPDYLKEIKNEIRSSTLVGISVMTVQVPNGLEISDYIKNIDPSIPIVWGGVHASLFPKKTLEDISVDFVIKNDGEHPILGLAKHFENGRGLKGIHGIYFKNNGKIIETKEEKPFDMDELDHVKWDILPKKIKDKIKTGYFGGNIHTSRGCPHRCTFCINTVTKMCYRVRSVEKVLRDLEDAREFGIKGFKFRDENFFVNRNRVEKIIDGMLEKEFEFIWNTSIRVDYISRGNITMEILEKAKKSGCKYLNFGAESGSQRILDILKKDITPKDTIMSAKVLNKLGGIIPYYSFMIGIPTETDGDRILTINLIDRLLKECPNMRVVGPHIFRPYPGGELYELSLKNGWIEPDSLRAWSSKVMEDSIFASAKNLPWVNCPERLEAISNSAYWTNGLKRMMSKKTIPLKILVIIFYLSSLIRWKTKFFDLPVDISMMKILRRYKSAL